MMPPKAQHRRALTPLPSLALDCLRLKIMNVLFACEQTGTTTPSSMRPTSRVAVQRGGPPTVTYRTFQCYFQRAHVTRRAPRLHERNFASLVEELAMRGFIGPTAAR